MLYPLLFYTDLSEMALQPAYNRMLNGCGPGASPRDWAVLVRQAMQRLGYPQSIRDAERRLLTSLADVLAVDDPAASQKAYSFWGKSLQGID
jgi:hypothetical protein